MATQTLNPVTSKKIFFVRRTDGIWQVHTHDREWTADFLVCVLVQQEESFCYAKDLVFDCYIDRPEFIPAPIKDILEQEMTEVKLADRAFYKLKPDNNWERCSSEDDPMLLVCVAPPMTPVHNKFFGAMNLVSGEEVALANLPLQVIKDINLVKE